MAKYCSNCGRKLEEGEICECKQKNNIEIKPNKVIELCKNIFLKPVETIKDFKDEKNFSIGVMLALIASVIVGFFSILFTKAYYKNAIALYSLDIYNQSYAISYYNVFITGVLISLVLSFVSALILYLVNNKMFKVEISYKSALNIISVLLIPSVVSILLSIIILPISIILAIIIILLSIVFEIIVLSLTEKEIFKLDNTKAIYANLIYAVGIMFIISIIISRFN